MLGVTTVPSKQYKHMLILNANPEACLSVEDTPCMCPPRSVYVIVPWA
jgi:hypothetical protein